MTNEQINMNRYYIDEDMVEHACCWGSAIVRKCEMGKGMYGLDVDLICECDKNQAQFICDALNSALDQLDEVNSDLNK